MTRPEEPITTDMTASETPYVKTYRGKVHIRTCGVGGHGVPMSWDEVREWVDAQNPRYSVYAIIGAQCCGSSPGAWLRINGRSR